MPYYKNYQNLPKKPVKTFHDLDVYQRALEMNVFVVNILAFSFYSQMAKIKNKKVIKIYFAFKVFVIFLASEKMTNNSMVFISQ